MLKVLVFMMLFWSSLAQADYVKAQLGVFTLSGSVEDEAGDSEDYKSAVASPLSIAYGVDFSLNYSMEVELMSYSNELEDINGVDAKFLGVGFNGLFHMTMPNGSVVDPYAGLGLAFGNYDLGALDDEFGVGVNFIVGASFGVTETLSLGAELRYNTPLLKPEFSNAFVSAEEVEFTNFSFGLTATYRLGYAG